MKPAALFCMFALTCCAPEKPDACPAIDRLRHRNAVADARTALATGDRHLLMLGGYVGTVPGLSSSSVYPTKMLEGTSDSNTLACLRQMSLAEIYASKYNRTIVRGD
ncbi:MAG: hypothetical protein EOP84_32235 [Verrucomicrobiaceae bacterium]|nr:MAG: hypothetical protein EOP84_32235 [Verrucomicrobiaceae bacterium]